VIKVFLSINNNEEVLQLPVPPEKYSIPDQWNNQKVEGLQQTLNLIGLRGLKTISISSFFPIDGHDYPFLQNREIWGREYVETIQRWRERRYPIRLIIADSEGKQDVNMAVTIDDFPTEVRSDGDIYYTLTMTEFVFVNTAVSG
jgi:hypothetical protein